MQTATPDHLDLRRNRPAEVVARAERALGVQLDAVRAVVKRRTIGAATDRGTWVRIEVRRPEKLGRQGFNGAEAAWSSAQEWAIAAWWALSPVRTTSSSTTEPSLRGTQPRGTSARRRFGLLSRRCGDRERRSGRTPADIR